MKRVYEKPVINIIKIETENVITESSGSVNTGQTQTALYTLNVAGKNTISY